MLGTTAQRTRVALYSLIILLTLSGQGLFIGAVRPGRKILPLEWNNWGNVAASGCQWIWQAFDDSGPRIDRQSIQRAYAALVRYQGARISVSSQDLSIPLAATSTMIGRMIWAEIPGTEIPEDVRPATSFVMYVVSSLSSANPVTNFDTSALKDMVGYVLGNVDSNLPLDHGANTIPGGVFYLDNNPNLAVVLQAFGTAVAWPAGTFQLTTEIARTSAAAAYLIMQQYRVGEGGRRLLSTSDQCPVDQGSNDFGSTGSVTKLPGKDDQVLDVNGAQGWSLPFWVPKDGAGNAAPVDACRHALNDPSSDLDDNDDDRMCKCSSAYPEVYTTKIHWGGKKKQGCSGRLACKQTKTVYTSGGLGEPTAVKVVVDPGINCKQLKQLYVNLLDRYASDAKIVKSASFRDDNGDVLYEARLERQDKYKGGNCGSKNKPCKDG